MEFLEKLGDWFNAFLGGSERFITNLFGSSNERRIKKLGFDRDRHGKTRVVPGTLLEKINSLEPEWEAKSDEELKQTAAMFRARLKNGETLDDILPEAYAAVRESGKRFLKMRHYDVQMIGGYILHQGMIAEMVTGEGKTLVSSLPAFLNALVGKVHVITVNDYLAKRDMEWMGPIHMNLGLTVGAIQANMRPNERQKEYACDITYGTNNEFGFDYLRDNMKPSRDLQVQGPLDFAIVDEIDNILIDEARTPLIISGPAHDDLSKYPKANQIVRQLRAGVDFEVKEKEHTCHLTEEGVRHAEELAGVESFYTAGNMHWPHLLDNALKAHHLYKRDVNYVVENNTVVIVDEFTGRKMEGRQWSDGLHQAVEAKEGVKVKEETQTLATITLQNYFKLYKKLGGMTGTAMTEAGEFWKIYKLDVVAVPTNRPLARINHPDRIYRSEKEKWRAVVNEVVEVHQTGRPVLVGTTSIEQSELVSNRLVKHGVQHKVLNAKNHEREAEIVAQAGRKNAVTIATNMAGRGTDIILGGNPEHAAWEELKTKYTSRLDVTKQEWDDLTGQIAKREGMDVEGEEVADLGGLHVIGTERHDSRRIDLQLRGRAGRQGDPGSSRFIISLEDKLMRLFAGELVQRVLAWAGMQEDEPIESKMVTRRVEGAQKKIEEKHFDQRKNLLEYDEVMDDQRKKVYDYRQNILDGANCRDLILSMLDEQVDHWTNHFLGNEYQWELISQWAAQALHVRVSGAEVQGMSLKDLSAFLRENAVSQSNDAIMEQIDEALPREDESQTTWNWLALSKWSNRMFGLNTNDRELKKIGRDGLFEYLSERAGTAIEKADLSPLNDLLDEDLPAVSMTGWLFQQYGVKIPSDDLVGKDPNEVASFLKEKLRSLYREKEITFPVAVGMGRFMAADNNGGERYDRDGLVRWANNRFNCELEVDSFEKKPRKEIEELLANCSREFYVDEDPSDKVDEVVNRAFNGNGNGNGRASDPSEITNWANREFQSNLTPDDFATLTRDDARQRVLEAYEQRYRPELQETERQVLLQILDAEWKDHLYHMGQVRDNIGLVSYAQKDPKTEYKREGRAAFNAMWEQIADRTTTTMFRMERESPGFVSSLWEITATTKEEYVDDFSTSGGGGGGESAGLEPGQSPDAVEQIVNTLPKVGRNDPCPCGSGKKFKKCCGRGM